MCLQPMPLASGFTATSGKCNRSYSRLGTAPDVVHRVVLEKCSLARDGKQPTAYPKYAVPVKWNLVSPGVEPHVVNILASGVSTLMAAVAPPSAPENEPVL
jgi:hypothetical protein